MRAMRIVVGVGVGLVLGSAGRVRAQGLADYDYENLTFRGVGVEVGRIWPSKVEPANSYVLRLDLGFLGPGVRISPWLGYWKSTMKPSELDRLAGQLNSIPALRAQGAQIEGRDLAPIDWSDLAANIDAEFVWRTPVRVLTYLGGSVGLHALNGQGPSIDNTFVEDLLDSISPSFGMVGGLEYQPIERLRVFGEARYTFMTDIHYPGLSVGVTLMLPPRGAPAPGGGSGNGGR